MSRPKQQGFTLIEILITLAVAAILLTMGTSLSKSWVDRNQAKSASASFKAAVLQAKAVALRNSNNMPLGNPAVSVCFDAGSKSINIIRTETNLANLCDVAGNALVRTFLLADNIQVKQGNTAVSCLVLNSSGTLIFPAGSGCTNDSTTAFSIGKNNETVQVRIL